ncbi:hypothetical protein GQE99_14540 [Maritimibacter sp. DP07]|uniref:Uncharacterized protein n=1 Tax=Maritimibacter harenae TaxID=2606218 RepID=A0A845M6Q4_9RHOB|nr:hypothetical protein [Maritimibacter harenae]MZR14238.1 hypothetical protein [Maritimibacter harenae]
MTLDEFGRILGGLEPGQGAFMRHSSYEMLFPPGEPDQGARERAYKFAREHGCKIDNSSEQKFIWFYREN